jgi:predicted DNA binding protein
MREAKIKLTNAELEELGFGELISHVRNAGLREIQMLEDEGYTCVPQIEVQQQLDEAMLNDLECVQDWEFVVKRGDSYVYLLDLTATGFSEEFVEVYNELLGDCDPTITSDGLILSFVGAQDSIRRVLRHYNAAGVSPDLYKLAEYDGGDETMEALTDRQLEVIRTALELGFYEVPRQASTQDIAAEIELNPATVSEHLQRAERNLLTKQLKV